jgi:hypothetical protein
LRLLLRLLLITAAAGWNVNISQVVQAGTITPRCWCRCRCN